MPEKWCSLLLGLFVMSLASVTSSTSSNELFTSSFLVRFKRSVDNSVAHDIANRNSFHNIGPVSRFLSCFSIINYVSFILSSPLSASIDPSHIDYFFVRFLIHQNVGKLTGFSSSYVDLRDVSFYDQNLFFRAYGSFEIISSYVLFSFILFSYGNWKKISWKSSTNWRILFKFPSFKFKYFLPNTNEERKFPLPRHVIDAHNWTVYTLAKTASKW